MWVKSFLAAGFAGTIVGLVTLIWALDGTDDRQQMVAGMVLIITGCISLLGGGVGHALRKVGNDVTAAYEVGYAAGHDAGTKYRAERRTAMHIVPLCPHCREQQTAHAN